MILNLSSVPNSANLMRLSWYLLQFRNRTLDTALELAKLPAIPKGSNVIDVEMICDDKHGEHNSYSQLAWVRHIIQDMAYEKVISYFEIDHKIGYLNGEWMLNYAQALSVLGQWDKAKTIVEDAYRRFSGLQNGYARCYCLLAPFICNPEKALPWFEKDIALGRLDKGYFRNYHAFILAELGEIEAATIIIDEIYASYPNPVNSYANLGWRHFAIKQHDYCQALRYFDKDIQARRFTPGMNILIACLHALLRDRDTACSLVQSSYLAEKSANGGYLLLGFCDYAITGDLTFLLSMVQKDLELKRLFYPHHIYLCSSVLLRCGNHKEAIPLVENAAARTNLAEGFARYWLKQVPALGVANYDDFITSDLQSLFAKASTAPTLDGALSSFL